MVRLPVPGSDDGQWGDLLNEFLGVEHNADGSLKASGSLAGKANDSAVVHKTGDETIAGVKTFSSSPVVPSGAFPQAAVNNLTTDLAAKASASHTHAALQGIYPLSAYGFFTASAAIEAFGTTSTVSAFFAARVFVPAGKQIVGAGTIVRTAGTVGSGGVNGFAVYEDDGTLASSTVSDNNLWSTEGWRTKAFPAPIAAQASDRFVYACILVSGYTDAPYIPYNVIGVGNLQGVTGGGYGVANHRRAFYSGASSWPASFDPTSYGSDPTGYVPLVALA